MRKIRLSDGTEYAINRCGAAENVLWLLVTDTTDIASLVPTFCDAEKTETITDFWTDDAMPPVTYTGYTMGWSFTQQAEGVLIALGRRGDAP